MNIDLAALKAAALAAQDRRRGCYCMPVTILALVERVRRLERVLFDVWCWFDDHDDRKTSFELHKELSEVVGAALDDKDKETTNG